MDQGFLSSGEWDNGKTVKTSLAKKQWKLNSCSITDSQTNWYKIWKPARFLAQLWNFNQYFVAANYDKTYTGKALPNYDYNHADLKSQKILNA